MERKLNKRQEREKRKTQMGNDRKDNEIKEKDSLLFMTSVVLYCGRLWIGRG